jgi:hypothetical protein
VDPEAILNEDSHRAAFDTLCSEPHIGQKITNEFLRHSVDIFGQRPEWREQLHVALDTNVVQTLVKTGAIVLEKEDRDRNPNQIINMNPSSDPSKLISYQDTQDMLKWAANDAGFSRIVFDELWLEHREFISNPLLQSESIFFDLVLEEYQY